ncbi:MAG: CBS domain-containing protein [Actinobacteria bacterium]|nr:MAG: CBS domain-containing protein [Actinomycetota bacterium]
MENKMNLEEVVSGELVASGPETTMEDLASLMESEGVGSVAILDPHGDFLGIVTDRDIVRAVAEGQSRAVAAKDFMTVMVDTIDLNTDVADAVDWMNATGYRHLPVTQNGRLIGMVSIKDLLWAIAST